MELFASEKRNARAFCSQMRYWPPSAAGQAKWMSGREPRDDVERADRVHLEEDHDRRLVERHEDVLAHRELLVRVLDGDALGALRHRLATVCPAIGSVYFGTRNDSSKSCSHLMGHDQSSEPAVLGAHRDRAAADGGEEHPGPEGGG